MRVGVPKESAENERRVSLSPDVAKKLIKKGLEVTLESGAGLSAGFLNEDYEKVGAKIVDRSAAFGEDYGVLISSGPLDRCLARAIFVVNPEGKITYVEYVKEIAEHPNYDAAIASAKG